ncbi:MAG: leucyl aminopeptidase family protein [Bacteroidales bacterium]|jgi:leucyl aminopeptidase|nr:leucyl aminopeptidase family protein [Bacteroidales bacterium]
MTDMILEIKRGMEMKVSVTDISAQIIVHNNASLNDLRIAGARFVYKVKEMSDDSSEWILQPVELFTREEISALYEGIFLAAYSFDKYKSSKKPTVSVSLRNFNAAFRKKTAMLEQEIKQVRDWVNEPFSGLDAAEFAKQITARAKQYGVKSKIWAENEITREMKGLLAVNKGSVDKPQVVELTYDGRIYGGRKKANAKEISATDKPIVLIGKGIVFDAGGMNIKTENHINDMKNDMAGGATVAGVAVLAARLKVPVYLKVLIPVTDNRLNGNALVPGDVFTMADGTTVEVTNTDAEGRLVLADAVLYAKKHFNPQLIFTVATLTGDAMRALGAHGIAAMQQNAEAQAAILQRVGEMTHERLCFFPMWKEYEEALLSDIADIKNCNDGAAGMITAAKYITYFANNMPLIHLDIAGTAHVKKPLIPYGTGATGIGVRLLTEFLQLQQSQ